MNEIAAHGGTLVDRVAGVAERAELLARVARGDLPEITLDAREVSDLELIASGAFSPLTGFMGRADHDRVVAEGRLADGLPWTIPITLAARDAVLAGKLVVLRAPGGRLAGVLDVAESYTVDRARVARGVFGTEDAAHPGVAYLWSQGERRLAGTVTLLERGPAPFPRYHAEPRELRARFRERGWRRIVGFQTRNPIHRAHEFLTKVALEGCDGLLVHPLIGVTKDDDVPAAVRMACYEVLLDGYYPRDRVLLATLPAAMRYAGPREAVLHALVRKNYGCTHFIVGRDHAGVGTYYPPYAAHAIFDDYAPEELGIVPLRFDRSFYCRRCGGMATDKSCTHGAAEQVVLSGSALREMLRAGHRPPEEVVRPEVAEVLIRALAGGPTTPSFEPFPELRTRRMVLRRLRPDDAEVVFRLQSEPEITKYYGRAPFRSRADAEKNIADELLALARGTSIRWGLELDGVLVGTAGFWRWNQPHHLAEVGYGIVPEVWGKGLVPEALGAILAYGFEVMGLHRIEANLDPANQGSIRVLEKMGFVREGVLRENWFHDGQRTDTWTYGLLASELRRG